MLTDKFHPVDPSLENLEEDTTTALVPNSDLNTAIDKSLLSLPLEVAEQQLIAKIIEAPTKEDLQHQFDLFNMNQSKKNALRIIKLNNLLSKVEDQAIERFEKRPDQVSHKELLEYMNVVSSQIDRAHKQVDTLNTTPPIQVLTQKNEVNINMGSPELDRDSKERVMDAISKLLQQVQTATAKVADVAPDAPIPAEVIEITDFEDPSTTVAEETSDMEE